MSKIKNGDRCADCKYCKSGQLTIKSKLFLYSSEQGFDPNRPAPVKCQNKVEKS